MDKAEALRRIGAEGHVVPVSQSFVVDSFRPEDAWGVVRLFYAVYGDAYPIDTYYIPEKIIEANGSGALHTVVARTASGDIVGQAACFRSSAPFAGLLEAGLGLVLPAYRNTFAAMNLLRYTMQELPPRIGVDALFGESVSHHPIMQKFSKAFGCKVVGLEINLMPAATYAKEKTLFSRVACVFDFKSYRDRPQLIHLPEVYRETFAFLREDLDIEREIAVADQPLPAGKATRVAELYYDFAQVGRFNVMELGEDFADSAARLDQQATARGLKVAQCYLNLADPCNGAAVEILRQRGYFMAGYLPRWFDSDAILMQKLWSEPDFESMRLHTAKAKTLLDIIRRDWERAQAAAVG